MNITARTNVRLANEAWESLMIAHASLMGTYLTEDMWKEASMREYDVLYTLSKHGKSMRISEIQQGVLLSQPALSRAIDRLVVRGLLARCTDEVDGRAVQVSLTAEGSRVQREIGLAHGRSVAREVSAHLTEEDMQDLKRLCKKLAGN